jgi:hypothetical protein
MHEIFGPEALISKAHLENENRPGQIQMAARKKFYEAFLDCEHECIL